MRSPELRGLGWRPQKGDIRDHRLGVARPAVIPPTSDLRALFPPVYDQLTISSCVFNSISAVVEYNFRRQKLSDFIPSRLFSYYNTRVIEGTVASDAGAEIRNGIKSVVATGVCSEDAWPYNLKNLTVKPSDQCYLNAHKRLIGKYQLVNQTLNVLRSCLAGGDPVIFGFSTYASFDSNAVAVTGNLPMPGASEAMTGGHAVVLVGHNDNSRTFLVRNSWGDEWGIPAAPGHFHMPYNYVINPDLASDFWTIQSVSGQPAE